MNVRRASKFLAITGLLAVSGFSRSFAQPSPSDFIAGKITSISAEQGTVTLQHPAVAYLHLPAATTVFHYVDPRLILRVKEGDRVRFRADRYEGTLRLTAIFPG